MILAGCLRETTDYPAAFAEFESIRRDRATVDRRAWIYDYRVAA